MSICARDSMLVRSISVRSIFFTVIWLRTRSHRKEQNEEKNLKRSILHGLFFPQYDIRPGFESALIRTCAVTILRAIDFRGYLHGHEFAAILLSVHILKRDGHRREIVYCPG